MKKSFLSVALATSFMATTAVAQQYDMAGEANGNMDWYGSIETACGLQNFVDGRVTSTIDQTVLSSTFSGGEKAGVSVRTNEDGYVLVFGEPVLLDAETGEDISYWAAEDGFDIVASATGTTLSGDNSGTLQQNGSGDIVFSQGGSYDVEADATVYSVGKGGFPAGDYIVRVPVSCVLEMSGQDSGGGQCDGNCGNGVGNGGGNGTGDEGGGND